MIQHDCRNECRGPISRYDVCAKNMVQYLNAIIIVDISIAKGKSDFSPKLLKK